MWIISLAGENVLGARHRLETEHGPSAALNTPTILRRLH